MKRLPILLAAAVLASGCASMVYAPKNADLNDPDAAGCDAQAMEDALVKSCRRLGEAVPVPSKAPFSEVKRRKAVADPFKLSEKPSTLTQVFLEFTPLGFFAPLFGYPPRTMVYTGRVTLPSGTFDFRVNAGEEFTKALPGSPPLAVAVRCRARGCALTSTPQ